MIEFKKVTKKYNGDGPALKSVDFAIDEGEFVSIIGHSGAGKTTLSKLIIGEEKPTSGKVLFSGINVSDLDSSGILNIRRKIGMIFQDFRLLAGRTAYENIAFAMEAAGKTEDEIQSDVPYVLDLVDMKKRAGCFPKNLSGGEKQRLAIARAIINQPEIIIADEPTGNLDPVSAYEVIEILKKINDLGTTVILMTHNTGVVDAIKKRVIALENGQILSDNEKGKYKI